MAEMQPRCSRDAAAKGLMVSAHLKATMMKISLTLTPTSAHLKATMMKISDPIMFGHIVRAYYAPLFEQHGSLLEKAGFNPACNQ